MCGTSDLTFRVAGATIKNVKSNNPLSLVLVHLTLAELSAPPLSFIILPFFVFFLQLFFYVKRSKMLIIPKSPMEFPVHISLGANTEAWDSFVIRPVNENFQLSLYKVIDSLEKKFSEKYYPIAVLNSRELCEDLFQEIVTAIANGDKVFRVKDYLEKINLKRDDLPAA